MAHDPNPRWYIVHTYAGHEKAVRDSLKARISDLAIDAGLLDVVVPTETVVEMRGGRRVETSRMFYPGYVLVQAIMSSLVIRAIKSTPKVTGFAGGQYPAPLTDDEVQQILYNVVEPGPVPADPRERYSLGDTLRVRSGPFAGHDGVVQSIDSDRGTLTLHVTIFGRVTPIELGFIDVEKMA